MSGAKLAVLKNKAILYLYTINRRRNIKEDTGLSPYTILAR